VSIPTLAAAGSRLVRPLVAGPVRRGSVLAAFPAVVYVAAGVDVVALTGPGAVQLPISLSLLTAPPSARSGEPVWIGAGAVVTRTARVRWVREAEPVPALRRTTPRALAAALAAIPAARGGLDTDLVLDADALLGRGPGLTPSGDDVLAGALVALRLLPVALGIPEPPLGRTLAAAVTEHAHRRTTTLSAALLRAAAAGAPSAPVTALLRALCGVGDVADAARRLHAVGATSGADLASGVALGAGTVLRRA
jgi:hypothetical protein